MTPNQPALDLADLLGASEEAVRDRLGEPTAATRLGPEHWLVYERGELSLRVRLETLDPSRVLVRSWTVTFGPGHASFEAACDAVGVTPAAADARDEHDAGPPVDASGPRLIRRPLPDTAGPRVHSLTAHARAGRIRSLTAFDEAPDWRAAGDAP